GWSPFSGRNGSSMWIAYGTEPATQYTRLALRLAPQSRRSPQPMRPTSRARVILQPAGGPEAAEHYSRTIRNPIRLSSILEFLEEPDADALAVQYPTGWTRVWGVTPGASGVNRAKWLQFAKGDRVLFCGQGKVFASA